MENSHKLDCIKIQIFCFVKYSYKRILQEDERQAIDYEKIPANHIFNNGLSLEYIKIVKVKIQQENGLHKFN